MELITEKLSMRPRQFSLNELMWLVTAAAVFFGLTKMIPAPGYGEVMYQVCWVLAVVVLRLLFGWRVALLLSVGYGAIDGLQYCFLLKHTRFRPLEEEIILAVMFGMEEGAVFGGLATVVGWLIHQLARITVGMRFPKSRNKTQDR
jgi:hypothetical protein